MSKAVVTAADLAMAERLAEALHPEGFQSDMDLSAVAALLAEHRETTLSCAVARMERMFYLWEKKEP